MAQLKVFKCGTQVTTKIGNIEGMIIAITIEFDKILYRVQYFVAGEEKVLWFHEEQFTTKGKRNTIGYRQEN